MIDFAKILHELEQLPQTWHASGPLDVNVLKKIAHLCKGYGLIKQSVETGAGKSTLFFSQVSQNHTVFAIDVGKSLTRVKESKLLEKQNVEFVEGPTQQTVPVYSFRSELDIVLIDGPHGYPFPDLEYYYFYPHIAEGGLLIIDDINIPSIKRMAKIIKSDDMFECLDLVGKTMFFQRTGAPLFDPLADGWWNQGYNKPYLRKTKQLEKIKKLMPTSLFNLIPNSLRLRIQRYL
jgi:hypothetical protein